MNINIIDILNAIQSNKLRISDHADEETLADKLTYDEIFYSVIHGEIIEFYPDDKPYPSCLIFGESLNSHPIHSVWAYNKKTQGAVLITVYRPDPKLWTNYRTRKKRS